MRKVDYEFMTVDKFIEGRPELDQRKVLILRYLQKKGKAHVEYRQKGRSRIVVNLNSEIELTIPWSILTPLHIAATLSGLSGWNFRFPEAQVAVLEQMEREIAKCGKE